MKLDKANSNTLTRKLPIYHLPPVTIGTQASKSYYTSLQKNEDF